MPSRLQEPSTAVRQAQRYAALAASIALLAFLAGYGGLLWVCATAPGLAARVGVVLGGLTVLPLAWRVWTHVSGTVRFRLYTRWLAQCEDTP